MAEELTGKLLALNWTNLEEAKPFTSKLFQNLYKSHNSEPPSLKDIVENYLNNPFVTK